MGRRARRAGALCLALAIGAASIAAAALVQQGNLRIAVLTQVIPYKLPRTTRAPIAVFVSGHLSTEDGHIPPQLRRMRIEVNRHGLLQSRGLPVCQIPRIQPASSERALEACGSALIGFGRFWGDIVLPGQNPYPTQGKLLIFNGRSHGHPVFLAHIYTAHPFNSSFVIAFQIKRIHDGPYGTELSASLPQALGDWGYLDRIKLTLERKYRYRGRQLSYFNASCPAVKGFKSASFPLARSTFYFAGAKPLSVVVEKQCRVKG